MTQISFSFVAPASALAVEDAPVETAISAAALALFLRWADDAPEWNGRPLVDGNVQMDKADCGHFTVLKKAGLLTTSREFQANFMDERGRRGRWETWLDFTEKGRALANSHGYAIGDGDDPKDLPPRR